MPNHGAANTRIKYFLKRVELQIIQLLLWFADHGHGQMRIHINIAMSWKMFGWTHDAFIPHAQHVLNAHGCYLVLVLSKRTVVDDGVVGIVVHVYHRGKIDLDAQLFALFCHPAAITVNQVGVAQGAEHHHPGQSSNTVQPHANTVFPINGHQDGCLGNGLQPVNEGCLPYRRTLKKTDSADIEFSYIPLHSWIIKGDCLGFAVYGR